MAKIKIQQVRSKIGSNLRQRRTLQALGFKKTYSVIEVEDTPQIRGMIEKINHLVAIL